MAVQTRYYGVVILALILIFALIHLSVGIAIIVTDNRYGDIFPPEIGLSAGVIAISFLGILVGAAGLFAILTDRSNFGEFQFLF
jgi:hypothetical protein